MEKNKFHQNIHFWGQITILLTIFSSFLIPIYLTFVKGFIPDIQDIITGIIAIIGFVGIVWIIEPISYYPTLGPAGTYMSFVSGNIGNMRIPVIIATQNALNLESGSEEAEVCGIFALISSILTNLVILSIVMFLGQYIVNNLPQKILQSFNYALPGILGAMIVMFGSKIKLNNIVKLLFLTFIVLLFIRVSSNFIPKKISVSLNIGNSGIVAIFGIVYALIKSKKDKSKS